MYECQEKQISKIAKATAETLAHWVSPEEAPETNPAKIEACMIEAVDKIADLTEMCFRDRHPSPEAKTEAIRGLLRTLLDYYHIYPCGYHACEAELIEIVKDELSERRREAIRGSFCDTWDDDPDPETADGYRQQDLIDMYRRER